MKRRTVLGLLLVGGLAACAMPQMTESPERAAEAEAIYGDLAAGRTEALVGKMSSGNDPATVKAQLPMLRTFIPAGTPPEPKTVGWKSLVNTSGQRYAIAQEYAYPDRTVRSETTFLKEGETWKVESFHVNAQMKASAPPVAADAVPTAPAT